MLTEPALAPARATSYAEILKSSAWIGASSVLNIAIGIVRTKVMAVLLGPAGFGLMGALNSVVDLARSLAQLGTNSSGVRQIAEAAGTADDVRIGQTIGVLGRVVMALGVIGAVALALSAGPISVLTFGSAEHAGAIALLSLALLMRLVADGQAALLQGLRRVADLAKVSVLGGVVATLVSVPMVYAFGTDGIAASIVATAAATLAATWWYRRRVSVPAQRLPRREFGAQALVLLKLGAAFMASALLMMAAAYAVRIIVLRHVGLDAAGLYQAAWTVGGLYVGLILQAMGTDFYPRLVAVTQDRSEAARLVNEQTRASLLLAAPGVIATLALAPLIMTLLYSESFATGVETLRWICLGMALRVITWPIGFIIVARGAQKLFFLTELAWTCVHISLAWYCVEAFGLDGAGIAFFGSYVFHGLMIYPIVRRISGFRWSAENLRLGAAFIVLVGAVFTALRVLPPAYGLMLGLAATAASAAYSARSLARLLAADAAPGFVGRGLTRLRVVFTKPGR